MDRRILVVDDELAVRGVVGEMLAHHGWEAAMVSGWDEALATLENDPRPLVLSDIRMPGRSGLELLGELRQRHPETLVLLMTGFPEMEMVRQALQQGAFDFLVKPVDSALLVRTVERAAEVYHLRREKERNQRLLTAIFESLGEAVATLDREGRILELNTAAWSVLGLDRERIGQTLAEASPGLSEALAAPIAAVVGEGASFRDLSMTLTVAGAERQAGLALTPLRRSGGEVDGVVLIARDETRLHTLERQLGERREFYGMIGGSLPMQEVYDLIEKLADVETTVLITGETGVGKEAAARALHDRGRRRDKPFVAVNCAALNEELLESELFGHVKGAFTHALRDKPGRFKAADGGTLFLDEIGDISPRMQVRLLRVLQDKTFEPVGDWRSQKVDVRVLAATHRHLEELVSQGEFREDLYYRLKVVTLAIPPLRSRRDDLPLLVERMVASFNRKFNKVIQGVDGAVMRLFMTSAWRGNVRELLNVLEHAAILCAGRRIGVADLPLEFCVARESDRVARGRFAPAANAPPPRAGFSPASAPPLDVPREPSPSPEPTSSPGETGEGHGEAEEEGLEGQDGLTAEEIFRVLNQCQWRVGETAKQLGVSRSTLWRKMRQFKLGR
ncbi:MAG: sigma 54-interacting transcriptional regulator [Magnetococcales bacterium]|nr:sigma 54-interacting transcriptional regulator [Magnetococcales bacterium]